MTLREMMDQLDEVEEAAVALLGRAEDLRIALYAREHAQRYREERDLEQALGLSIVDLGDPGA
jgi:hypothetical protein